MTVLETKASEPAAGAARCSSEATFGGPSGRVSISANHRRYRAMDRALGHERQAIRSHWFAAAACVTHPLRGLGTVDSGFGRLAFNNEQVELLRFVHAGLFEVNLGWFAQMRQGTLPDGFAGRPGRELDHAMVDAEQRRFTQLVHDYFRDRPSDMVPFMSALSTHMQHSLVLRSRLVAPALREALQRVRGVLHIDMACESHRARIGHQLVDHIRQARGAGQT